MDWNDCASLTSHFRCDLIGVQVVSGRINVNKHGRGAHTRDRADACKERVWRGDYFIAWADVLSHQASQQSVRSRGNSDCVRTPAILCNCLLALFHLRPHDYMLRLHDLRDRRLNLGLDRSVWRLKSGQRNMHAWLPLSVACKT